jgi:hypothetical protein
VARVGKGHSTVCARLVDPSPSLFIFFQLENQLGSQYYGSNLEFIEALQGILNMCLTETLEGSPVFESAMEIFYCMELFAETHFDAKLQVSRTQPLAASETPLTQSAILHG